MQNQRKHDNLSAEKPRSLDAEYVKAIEAMLDKGFLVELFKLRDGQIVARSVKKKEITTAN